MSSSTRHTHHVTYTPNAVIMSMSLPGCGCMLNLILSSNVWVHLYIIDQACPAAPATHTCQCTQRP